MGDLDLLSSKWDTINALVFLINDVGYENTDKLTLLAAVCESVCACVCVWWTERERETGLGYRQLLRVCTVCVEP